MGKYIVNFKLHKGQTLFLGLIMMRILARCVHNIYPKWLKRHIPATISFDKNEIKIIIIYKSHTHIQH